MTTHRSHWRNHATKVIKAVLKDTKGQEEKAIRKALREAYPFGERAYHPYKIWLDEIQRQRGLKPPLGTKERHDDPAQAALFGSQE